MRRIILTVSFLLIIMVGSAFTEEETNPQYTIYVHQDTVYMGEIIIELYPDIAPEHCRNFDSLVNIHFFDGTVFHRIIPGVLIQGGDPNTKDKSREYWGMGDPSQRRIKDEFNDTPHTRGIISAAKTFQPNSHTSQFFICARPLRQLDNQYSVFGTVIEGMEIVDKISALPRDDEERPLSKVTMKICRNE